MEWFRVPLLLDNPTIYMTYKLAVSHTKIIISDYQSQKFLNNILPSKGTIHITPWFLMNIIFQTFFFGAMFGVYVGKAML